MVSLCQHVVENEEIEGTVDGGARVVADSGVDVGEGAINVWRRGQDQSREVSLKGHRIVSILGSQSGYL